VGGGAWGLGDGGVESVDCVKGGVDGMCSLTRVYNRCGMLMLSERDDTTSAPRSPLILASAS